MNNYDLLFLEMLNNRDKMVKHDNFLDIMILEVMNDNLINSFRKVYKWI